MESKPAKNLDKAKTIGKLKNLGKAELKLMEKDGQVFLSGTLSKKEVPGERAATKFLEENKTLFGIDSVDDNLKVIEVEKDDMGDTFVKYAQVIDGIQVDDSFINVHFDENKVISSVNGNLEENKTTLINP